MVMRNTESGLPARKRDTALCAAEEIVLESIKAQHPEWVDEASGECAQCVAYEHELARGQTGISAADGES